MLKNCQEILSRVSTLALAYHLTGDKKYALRAKEELIFSCKFSTLEQRSFFGYG